MFCKNALTALDSINLGTSALKADTKAAFDGLGTRVKLSSHGGIAIVNVAGDPENDNVAWPMRAVPVKLLLNPGTLKLESKLNEPAPIDKVEPSVVRIPIPEVLA